MKTWLMAMLAPALTATLVHAGPQVSFFVGTGGGLSGGGGFPAGTFCAPRQSFCAPVFLNQSWGYWGTSFWGPTSWYVEGPSSPFRNYSPIMNYESGQPVYKVPPPIVRAEPLVIYPGSSFGWRR